MATTAVHYTPGAQVTIKAGADLTAGTFVKISAPWDDRRNPVVTPAAAADTPFGFVRNDTGKDDYVTVYRGKYIADFVAEGNIKGGATVAIGAAGKVKTATEGAAAVGIATADASNGYVSVAVN